MSRALPPEDLSAEHLRAAALEVLGPHGDERARRILEQAELVVHHGVSGWEGSEGAVRAHRVDLGLDAASLARMHHIHALHDALSAAVAAALSRRPGETLSELRSYWHARDESAGTAYRGVRPRGLSRDDGAALLRAAAEYLEAAGEKSARRIVTHASLEVEHSVRKGKSLRRLVLWCAHEDQDRVEKNPACWSCIVHCLETLALEPEPGEVQVLLGKD